jgi:hypothetical protein
MESMLVTALTFQFEMSELKLDAPLNMDCMFVTAPTFQFEMSELKLDFPKNSIHVCDMLHTPGYNQTILRVSGTAGIVCFTSLTDVIVNSSF